jgi:hypothetical protein
VRNVLLGKFSQSNSTSLDNFHSQQRSTLIKRPNGRCNVISILTASLDNLRTKAYTRGICGRRSDSGTCFLRALRVPLPILISPTAPR